MFGSCVCPCDVPPSSLPPLRLPPLFLLSSFHPPSRTLVCCSQDEGLWDDGSVTLAQLTKTEMNDILSKAQGMSTSQVWRVFSNWFRYEGLALQDGEEWHPQQESGSKSARARGHSHTDPDAHAWEIHMYVAMHIFCCHAQCLSHAPLMHSVCLTLPYLPIAHPLSPTPCLPAPICPCLAASLRDQQVGGGDGADHIACGCGANSVSRRHCPWRSAHRGALASWESYTCHMSGVLFRALKRHKSYTLTLVLASHTSCIHAFM